MVKRPKGTQDIYTDAWIYRFIENSFLIIAKNFGYKEMRTPIFECASLFKLSIGAATDVVKKELYQFQDKSNRELALRPEGTTPVIRAFIENNLYVKNESSKFFYIANMFRYERPQKGRRREFRQLGIERVGIANSFAVVESIVLANSFLKAINITYYKIVINSLGLQADRKKYTDELKKYFEDKLDSLCSDCNVRFKINPLRLLDCKVDDAASQAPNIMSFISKESQNEYKEVKELLKKANIDFVEDSSLVRGLDYYSNTVYEFIPNGEDGSQAALLAGGQYFELVKNIGGPDVKGVGFAAGAERLINIIKTQITKPKSPTSVFVVASKEDSINAFQVVNELRASEVFTEFDPEFPNIKIQFKKVAKNKFDWAIICEGNQLILKHQKHKEQFQGNTQEVINYIKEKK